MRQKRKNGCVTIESTIQNTAAATAVGFIFEHVGQTHGKSLYVYRFQYNNVDVWIWL